jgi:hypothetical protein
MERPPTQSTSAKTSREPGAPYCSNCGYDLSNLTESSKCPECGRPLVEVLTRGPAHYQMGKRYRSKATLFGLPVIDIALGPKGNELRGRAKGIIAIGDIATGFIALGGFARGLVAIGGMAFGGFAIGGMAVGIFTAIAGLAIGGIAIGGGAVGVLAVGGGAAGHIAQGGGAYGYYARGGDARGAHVIAMGRGYSDAEATRMFDRFAWFFGGSDMRAGMTLLRPAAVPLVTMVGVCALIALMAMIAMRNEPD